MHDLRHLQHATNGFAVVVVQQDLNIVGVHKASIVLKPIARENCHSVDCFCDDGQIEALHFLFWLVWKDSLKVQRFRLSYTKQGFMGKFRFRSAFSFVYCVYFE